MEITGWLIRSNQNFKTSGCLIYYSQVLVRFQFLFFEAHQCHHLWLFQNSLDCLLQPLDPHRMISIEQLHTVELKRE